MFRGVFTFLKCQFGKDRAFYRNLIGVLGFLPGRLSLYKIAFTHRSVSIQMKDGTPSNNERLEYLGDALLSAVVAEFVYHHYNRTTEGYMTKLRSRIVKRKHLNAIAIEMGIPRLLSCHPQTIRASKHLYGNALEALVGAIYLDRGYRAVSRFFRNRLIGKYIDLKSLVEKDSDYKSQLIEWAQKTKQVMLFNTREEYDTPGKVPTFHSTVRIDQVEFGKGTGDSKKEAEQQAAKNTLKSIPGRIAAFNP